MPSSLFRHRPRSNRRAALRLGTALLTVGLSTLSVALLRAPQAGAATDVVTSCSGDPTVSGSLPFVVAHATAGDMITFSSTCPPGSPIILSQTLAIGVNLNIDGPGSNSMAVSGGHTVQVLSVAHGVTVAISGLTIENGQAGTGTAGTAGSNANGPVGANGGTGGTAGNGGPGDSGGGIDNSGILTLTDTVVTGNAAGAGASGGPGGSANGGAGAGGQSGQTGGTGGTGGSAGTGGTGGTGGSGGGIDNNGTLSLVASTVSGNAAGAGGGGGPGGDAVGGAGGTGGNSTNFGGTGGAGGNGGTLSGAGGPGGTGGSAGGIYNSGTVSLVASTISANAAGTGGAGGHSGDATGGTGGFGGPGGANDGGGNGGAAGTGGTAGTGGNGGTGGRGGGIDDTGSATLTNSTVAGNAAGTGGAGGPGNESGGGTGGAGGDDFHGNAFGGTGGAGGNAGTGGDGGDGGTGGGGGGVTDAGSLILTSATIASNGAGSGGNGGNGGTANGGAGGSNGSPFILPFSTGGLGGTAGNGGSGGSGNNDGGINGPGSLTTGATIVGGNSPADCALGGTVIDAEYNLDSDGSCGFHSPGDRSSTDADLGPLQANGGPTFTMAPSLSPKSPVIDVVPAGQCPATDQRGAPRTAPCDIGAYDTDQAPFTTAIDVTVSGSQTFDSGTPTFTETNDAPNGVTVTGPTTCTSVNGGTPLNSALAVGDYTIDSSSCSGLVSSNAQYPIFPSTTVGATNGFVVTKDSTSVGLSSVPGTEPFGSEASNVFTVTVLTGNGEELPGTENVTVDVGTTTCVAPVAPAPSGGSGSCSIGNSDLAVGTYTASTSYLGDAELQGSRRAAASFIVGLVLTKPPLANPVFDVPYTTTITAGGATAPTTFTESGSLPDGITLHTNGVLSGTPTNATQIGTAFPFTVKATDSATPANVATQLYSITVGAGCGAGLTPHVLSATSGTGSFTGLFCVNASGSGTYAQAAVHGTGTITSSGGVTRISAFGTNLALLGQKTTTTSTFTESAPPPAKAGNFTLS